MITISENYWENTIAILLAFAILALIIERALYQIFDLKLWQAFEDGLDKQVGGDFLDLKPWISVAVSMIIVFNLNLDMIAMIFEKKEPLTISLILSGLFIAGGSTGIYKFFKRARKLKEVALKEKINEE